MITMADNWQDYKLLDAGGGEKLERWGEVTVVRPDPQAFWPKNPHVSWSAPDMYYHRSKSGGGSWEILNKNVPESWQINYGDLRFHIRPTGFKHMGLFPEQAVNWDWMQQFISKGDKVLNLFAYTGGATLACLKAGANATHIDAAKGMNRWAKDNITLSGFAESPFRIMEDDALKFVQREGRRNSLYEGIIMDPPVFGRGPGGEMWKLEEKLYELIDASARIFSQNPKFMLINGYTAGFSAVAYGNILQFVADKHKLKGKVTVGEIGLPAKSGITLPCGIYARWQRSE